MGEHARYFRPASLPGVEALHARFVCHAYIAHSHPTWTVALVHHGAARFELEATQQRAQRGELFVLEPEAVHTGMAAVPEGWAYPVLYLDPALLSDWDERDAPGPRAARWVVFRDVALRDALLRAHAPLGAGAVDLELDEVVLAALDALRPHLRPGPPALRGRPEPGAVRRARARLAEHWDAPGRARRARDRRGACAASSSSGASGRRSASPRTPSRSTCRLRRLAGSCAPASHPPASRSRVASPTRRTWTRAFKRAVGVPPGRFAAA